MVTNNKFDIVVCGGGLGGLGAAIGLTLKGHKVTVMEAAEQLNEVGAGIQVPPNSSRILDQYGVYEEFQKTVTVPRHIQLRRYNTGEILDATPLHPRMTDEYGYPYWLIHRADYQNILYERCVELGVEIRNGCRVDYVNQDDVTVHLTSGEVVKADLVVGADGIRSRVRDSAVVPEEEVKPAKSTNCAYRATVPRDVMMIDELLAPLMTDVNCNCWLGYRRHIMAYPIRNGELYNIVMSHPGEAAVGRWNEPGNPEEMRTQYKDWDPVVCRLLTKVNDDVLKWVLADMPMLPRYTSASGRVIILGDAAHAMLPYLAQGAAQAMEDGACLSTLLDKCNSIDDIPTATKEYERKRKKRTEAVQEGARKNAQIWHLPDGESQEERDEEMKNAASKREAGIQNPNQWSDPTLQNWLFGWNAFID
jgi:salicylate hydroxylase